MAPRSTVARFQVVKKESEMHYNGGKEEPFLSPPPLTPYGHNVFSHTFIDIFRGYQDVFVSVPVSPFSDSLNFVSMESRERKGYNLGLQIRRQS